MCFFGYEKIGSEILHSCENRTEDGIIANAKVQKVKNEEFLYSYIYKKTYFGSRVACMIRLTFVYYVYIQKTYKGCFS